MRLTHALAALLLMAPMTVSAASAETSPATLRLLVVDQTNAVLPHATVTIYTLDGKPGVRATADEHGIVYLPSVPAGLTQIVASYPGFAPSLEKATLKRGQNLETVKLRLAPVVVKVTVKPTDSLDRSS
jgi:hypothetical protein